MTTLRSVLIGIGLIVGFLCPIVVGACTIPPAYAGIVIAGMSSFSALSTAFGFQILSLRRELRRGAGLDDERRELLRRRLDRSIQAFFFRWSGSFFCGISGAGLGLIIRENPQVDFLWLLITAGFALCLSSIFFLCLMIFEYRSLLQFATELEDHSESVKRNRDWNEKLGKIRKK